MNTLCYWCFKKLKTESPGIIEFPKDRGIFFCSKECVDHATSKIRGKKELDFSKIKKHANQIKRKNERNKKSLVEMTRLFNERFSLQITLKQMETLAYKHRIRNGIGSFRPGHVPANKGKTHKPEQGNYRPIGSERIISGYVEIKTDHSVWDRKHTAIWKAANGKVPKGHVVIFADGNNRNFELYNLMLVSRKELGVMNKLDLITNHKDLTAVGKTIADMKMAIGKRKRKLKRRKVK